MSLTRGQRLRRLRTQRGVEIKEAAPAMGITSAYLSLLERDLKGKNLKHVRSTFESAAAYYGVLVEYLLVETPQEYMAALTARHGSQGPATLGRRLRFVLDELVLRWGDEFRPDAIVETLGITPNAMAEYLADRTLPADTAIQQLSAATGAPVDWLIQRADPPAEPLPALSEPQADLMSDVQSVVQNAIASGLTASELNLLIQGWVLAKQMKKPSG
ncbi:MAG TPA: helix-turn-helix domain-containing protein [Symbiobacteriaceae bacterium]